MADMTWADPASTVFRYGSPLRYGGNYYSTVPPGRRTPRGQTCQVGKPRLRPIVIAKLGILIAESRVRRTVPASWHPCQ
eukprot:125666-Hanusia_phi.AAC.1